MRKRRSTSTSYAGVVRASRDGHQYHDVWAARVALQLVPTGSVIAALAMEGFAGPIDEDGDEIADVVLYHGAADEELATRIDVVQLKYSHDARPATLSYLSKTIEKFAGNFRSAGAGKDKLRYEFVCNRAISRDVMRVIEEMREGSGESPQGRTFREALTKNGIAVDEVVAVLRRLTITPLAGSIGSIGTDIRHTIASWSAADSGAARDAYLNLVELLRTKAGSAGSRDNVVRRVDVLRALGVNLESDLLPCPAEFPQVDRPLVRSVVREIAAAAMVATKPILVHAPGGGGKTVVMQLLAHELGRQHVVLMVDGFAGGRWRDPAQARHLPRRALVHIANELACIYGLCDILLPRSYDDDAVLTALRRRLERAASEVRNRDGNARVVLLLDAIDHPGQAADVGQNEQSFARLLLASLAVSPIAGIVVVASCRSERRRMATGRVGCTEIAIPALTIDEVREIAKAADLTAPTGVAILKRRSRGNPRTLAALIRQLKKAGAAGPASNAVADLDELIGEQLEEALAEADRRGSSGGARTLLTAIAALPPPVPVAELAAVFGAEPSIVDSIVSDLHPLIEATASGLIFRDEPTEKVAQQRYRDNAEELQKVIVALNRAQDSSVYAAQVLPGLLAESEQVDTLLCLAFDRRAPTSGDPLIGERGIRLARVIAAIRACVRADRRADLFRLALEAAFLSGGTSRLDEFLLSHPELAVVSRDALALRRLEEQRGAEPIRRHAALAVYYGLAGDLGEAAWHARRNLDWLYAPPRQRDGETGEQGYHETVRDWAASLFVEVGVGNEKKVVAWLGKVARSDFVDAFGMADALVRLLDRERSLDGGRTGLARFADRVLRGGRGVLPLIVALIGFGGSLPARTRERLLTRAAILAESAKPLREPRGWRDESFNLCRQSLLTTAVWLTAAGQRRGVEQLLRLSGADRVSSWRHRGEPSYGEATLVVVAAAVRSALYDRKAALIDLAPSDLREEVEKHYRGRDPAEFEAMVQRLLRDPEPNQGSASTEPRLDYEKRQELNRVVERLRKLLPTVASLAEVIPNATAESNELAVAAVKRVADSIGTDVGRWSLRDDASYFGRVGAEACLIVLGALDRLRGGAGRELVEMVSKHRFYFIPFKTGLVLQLARHAETNDLATTLAGEIASEIGRLEDVGLRVDALAELARVLIAASSAEAKAYVGKALATVDGLGAGEIDSIYPLVRICGAATLPAAPEAAHALNRLAEVNFSDEPGKFVWWDMGRAMAQASGARALAQVTRWDRRRVASASYAAAPLLTTLVAGGQLGAAETTALIGIDEPVGSWTWDLATFAEAVLPRLQGPAREIGADAIVTEWQRLNGGFPRLDRALAMQKVFTANLPPTAAAVIGLDGIVAALQSGKTGASPPLWIPSEQEQSALRDAVAGIAPLDATALDRAMDAWKDKTGRPMGFGGLVEAVAEKVSGIDDRIQFLDAVIATEQPLQQKLFALERLWEKWSKGSVAVRDHMPVVAARVAGMHALDLVSSGWQMESECRRLAKIGLTSQDLVQCIVRALGRDTHLVPSRAWLTLAEAVVGAVPSESELRRTLDRFLQLSSAGLPADVAEGPWGPHLAVPDSAIDIVAGVLWCRLGDADAETRWRAAHAVVRIEALGLHGHVDAVIAYWGRNDAGPFSGQAPPFLARHAQLWLMMALVRIAARWPAQALRFRRLFEDQIGDGAGRHALLSHFSLLGLTHIAGKLGKADRKALLATIARERRSPHGYVAEPRFRPDTYASPPEPQEKQFYFEYGFHKYQIDGLARVFGLPTWQVERLCAARVKAMDPAITHWFDAGRGRQADDNETRGSSSAPRRDVWGTYLSWHALFETAGDLFASHPIVRGYDDECLWARWLEEFSPFLPDGSWRADATRLPPPRYTGEHWPRPEGEDGSPLPERAQDLGRLIADNDEMPSEWMPVKGYWLGPGGYRLSMSSSMIGSGDAVMVAHAVMAAAPHDRWLPEDSDHDFGGRGRSKPPLKRWLRASSDDSRGLDWNDPYASSLAFPCAGPADWFAAAEKLTASPTGAAWSAGGGVVLCTRAWGGAKRYVRREVDTEGYDLVCKKGWLRSYLSRHDAALLVLIKADWSAGSMREPKRDSRELMLIVRGDGSMEKITSVPDEVTVLIDGMDEEVRHDLSERFACISAVDRSRSKE